MSMNRIAVVASVIWVLAVASYAIGYVDQLGTGEGTRTLPTLDLMLFVFAIAGPLAMLWIVVVLLNRTAALSDSIAAQSDSALALATTLAALNDSIDVLSESTHGKLAEAAERMERHAEVSTDAFERNLAETGSRLNHVMLESIVLIDERIAGRIDTFEAALEQQRTSLDQHLRQDTARISEALEAQRVALDQRMNEDTTRLTAAIEAELAALAGLRAGLVDHVRAGLAESKAQLDEGIAASLADQKSGMAESNQKLDAGLEAFTTALARLQDEQARLADNDIAAPVRALTAEIAETRKTLMAHPPASVDSLADLLGKSAQQLLRHDRKALEGLLLRVEGLEQKAGDMLSRIDRTSRLNPLMDRPRVAPERTEDARDAHESELPFSMLPRSAPRLPVNWIAAVRALEGDAALPAAPHTVRQAALDPDIALVLKFSGSVAAGLAEDRVHLEDLSVQHASAALWHRYALGERSEEIAALGDVADDITLALVRARLRGDAEFRALAIRYADVYGRLLVRAADQMGPDPKLVEMADTRPGRAFLLLGGLVGAFTPGRPAVRTED